jgi:hypothetical protein
MYQFVTWGFSNHEVVITPPDAARREKPRRLVGFRVAPARTLPSVLSIVEALKE